MNTRESFRKTLMATSAALVAAAAVLAAAQSQAFAADNHVLRSAIAIVSTRHNPTARTLEELFNAAEIYLIDPDGSNARRLTDNAPFGDGFPALSPDRKKVVFDSNRERDLLSVPPEPLNTSDLFVMEVADALDGALGGESHLVRGSSATWSPDGKHIAYHASQSGVGLPIDPTPGAATTDSDIFVLNVDDFLAGILEEINLTNDGAGEAGSGRGIDDDADWSPDGEKIVFTSHPSTDHPTQTPFDKPHAEIYVMNADGTGRLRLTFNTEE